MFRIGFDNDEPVVDPELLDEDGNPIVKQGDRVIFEKKRDVYLSPKRLEQLKEEFSCTVVNEFGDEYHLTEEERREKNQLYDVFKKFRKYKHTYRKLDEYVTVMREALECLRAVAENNGIYSNEEFMSLFMKKKIKITGLRLPRYKGRDRKKLSWDFITEFILSNEPAENVLPKPKDEMITDDDYESAERKLFNRGELDRIMEPPSEKENMKYEVYFDIEEDKQTDMGMAISLTKKEQKSLMKSQPELLYTIKEGRRLDKSISNLNRLAHTLTSDDLDMIEINDRKYGFVSSSDMPSFNGDLSDNKSYYKYLMSLDDFEIGQIKENYGGKLKTKEQISELELKQVLESEGWNLRNLYENKEKEKRLKKARDRDKKQEKKIKQKLLEVQNRRKRRMGEDVDDSSHKKKKKKKDDEKKMKKAINKKKKDVEEFMNKSAIMRSDKIDFDEYEADILDWTSDNIFK